MDFLVQNVLHAIRCENDEITHEHTLRLIQNNNRMLVSYDLKPCVVSFDEVI